MQSVVLFSTTGKVYISFKLYIQYLDKPSRSPNLICDQTELTASLNDHYIVLKCVHYLYNTINVSL